MKVQRIYSESKELIGFEFSNVYIRRSEAVKLLKETPGVLIVKTSKYLRGERFFEFNFMDTRCELSEWWNDSSFYTVYCGGLQGCYVEQLISVFENWEPPKYRVILIKLWFIAAFSIFAIGASCAIYRLFAS